MLNTKGVHHQSQKLTQKHSNHGVSTSQARVRQTENPWFRIDDVLDVAEWQTREDVECSEEEQKHVRSRQNENAYGTEDHSGWSTFIST